VNDAGGPVPFDMGDTQIALNYGLRDEMHGKTSPIRPDGTFSMAGPASSVILTPRLPRRTPNVVVKSVRLDGVDVTNGPISLRAGARQHLEIVVTF
jgi:hypothetical protein